MTDEQAAEKMVVLLRGDPVGRVTWKLNGELHEETIIGHAIVKIPKGAEDVLYKWVVNGVVWAQWIVPPHITYYFQPYAPYVQTPWNPLNNLKVIFEHE